MNAEKIETSVKPQTVENERKRLNKLFKEYPLEKLQRSLRKSEVNDQGTPEELIDRLVRWDLSRLFGSTVA